MTDMGYVTQRIVETLWSLSLQIAVLVAIVWALSLCSRRASANFRYALWAIVLLRLCLPVTPSMPYGLSGHFRDFADRVVAAVSTDSLESAEIVATSFIDDPNAPPTSLPPQPYETPGGTPPVAVVAEETQPPASLPSNKLALIWAGMVVLIGALTAFRVSQVSRAVRETNRITEGRVKETLDRLSKEIGLEKTVHLYSVEEGGRLSCPAVIGVRQPKILLPGELVKDWPIEDIEPLLLHELAHVKRLDLWVNALQVIVQVFYFFHPLVWLANWRIRQERELACDDFALRHTSQPRKHYCESILRVVEQMKPPRPFAFAGIGFTERHSSLGRRILRIMDRNYKLGSKTSLWSMALALVIGASCVVLASDRAEEEPSGPQIEGSVSIDAKTGDSDTPGFQQAGEEVLSATESLKNVETALMMFHMDHERFPESLDQLVGPIFYFAGRDSPSDPHEPTETLRYLVDDVGKECRVYSVGEDGVDDGGDPEKDVLLVLGQESEPPPGLSPEEKRQLRQRSKEDQREAALDILEKCKARVQSKGGILIPSEEEIMRRLEEGRFPTGHNFESGRRLGRDLVGDQGKSPVYDAYSLAQPWNSILPRLVFLDVTARKRKVPPRAQVTYGDPQQDLLDHLRAVGLEGRPFAPLVQVVWIPKSAAEVLSEPRDSASSQKLVPVHRAAFDLNLRLDFEVMVDPSLAACQVSGVFEGGGKITHGPEAGLGLYAFPIGTALDREELILEISRQWKVPIGYAVKPLPCVYVYDPTRTKEETISSEIQQTSSRLKEERKWIRPFMEKLDLSQGFTTLKDEDLFRLVSQIDFDTATIEDVIRVFGNPYVYRAGDFRTEDGPGNLTWYYAHFPDGITVFVQKGRIQSIQFSESNCTLFSSIRVGTPLQEVVEMFPPRKTERRDRSAAREPGILYDFIGSSGDQGSYELPGGNVTFNHTNKRVSSIILTGNLDLRGAMLASAEKTYEEERFSEAIPAYEQIYEKYPDWNYASHALMMIGICYDNMGEKEKALEALEFAAQAYPDVKGWSEATFYYLGSAYIQAGSEEEALVAFRESVELCEGVREPNQFPCKDAREQIQKLEASEPTREE